MHKNLGACPCTWEIEHEKEQLCMLLILTWYSSRNCTKLLLKPLAAKNCLSISVLCIAPFLLIILFQFTWWLPSIFAAFTLHNLTSATIFDKLKWEVPNKSKKLTMDHELVRENSSSAAVYTLLNAIIYLRAIKYLNIRLRQIY